MAARARQQDRERSRVRRDYRPAVGQPARRIDEIPRLCRDGSRMSRVGWIRIAVIAIAIGLLEFCCRVGLIDHRVVIPPSEMADALVRLLISGQANEQIVRTFGIVIVAALISVVAGFALGVVIHALPRVRQALDPFFATYYAV